MSKIPSGGESFLSETLKGSEALVQGRALQNEPAVDTSSVSDIRTSQDPSLIQVILWSFG